MPAAAPQPEPEYPDGLRVISDDSPPDQRTGSGSKDDLESLASNQIKVPPVPSSLGMIGRMHWHTVCVTWIRERGMPDGLTLLILERYCRQLEAVDRYEAELVEYRDEHGTEVVHNLAGAPKAHPLSTRLERASLLALAYERELNMTPKSRSTRDPATRRVPESGVPGKPRRGRKPRTRQA